MHHLPEPLPLPSYKRYFHPLLLIFKTEIFAFLFSLFFLLDLYLMYFVSASFIHRWTGKILKQKNCWPCNCTQSSDFVSYKDSNGRMGTVIEQNYNNLLIRVPFFPSLSRFFGPLQVLLRTQIKFIFKSFSQGPLQSKPN